MATRKNMERDFEILLNKKIYAILDGDTSLGESDNNKYQKKMPYLSGPDIVTICNLFGLMVSYGPVSRWVYMEELLKYGIKNGRCNEILKYLFSKKQFEALTNLPTSSEIEKAYNTIVLEAINKINITLLLSNRELRLINGNFYISEVGNPISVSIINMKTIDVPYVRGLRERCEEDFENQNYDSVITKSRTLIEEVLIYILEQNSIVPTEKGGLTILYNQVKNLFGTQQSKSYDRRVNSMLGGLEKIVNAICEMRNNDSDAHGAGQKRIAIRDYEARLAMNSSITFCEYYLDLYNHHKSSI